MSNKKTRNISKYAHIKENTFIYIINGQWTAEIKKDSQTNELFLYIPFTKETKKIKQNTIYRFLFPEDNIRVYEEYED